MRGGMLRQTLSLPPNERLDTHLTIGYFITNGYIGVTETMPTRQEIRSEETKRAILNAARDLFATRGYDSVTMREIAKAAGCSHTTIYIYYTDKEALLHQLSMEPLQSLYQQMKTALQNPQLSPDDRLRSLCRTYIHFCLANRTMYNTFFMARGSRVDEAEPALEVQQLRNQLFALLLEAVRGVLPAGAPDDQVLANARVLFFTLHGVLCTYPGHEEPLEELMARLTPTFDLTVDVLLAGIKQTGGKAE